MSADQREDEMTELTEKLHSYIKRMRELRNGAPSIDSANFFKSVDALEREMKNVKIIYEKEIQKLRDQLQDLNVKKNHLELQNSKLEENASELQNRLVAEIDKTRRLNNDLNSLQRALLLKEQDIQDAVQKGLDDSPAVPNLTETNRKLDQTLRENMDLHRRYEAELMSRRGNEEKVHQLEEQIAFKEELYRQQQHDLQDRLAAANTAILNLEGKVRVLDRPDHEKHVAEMLSSVRDAAERELYKYKQATEEEFAKNVTILKSQMDADRKTFEAVTDENRKLVGVIEELNTKIRNLQGDIIHMEHLKRSAEENLQLEKERSARHIQAMEGKLKELQDILFDKMKELNAARIQNLPLKAEVESLRALIDEEEKRLAMEMKLPPFSYTVTRSPQATAPQLSKSINEIAEDKNLERELPGGGNLYAPDAVTRTVQIEPAARLNCRPSSVTHRAVGPIIPASSQSVTSQRLNIDGLSERNADVQPVLENETQTQLEAPENIKDHDYNNSTNSATGDLRIYEVNPSGRSVVLVNMSADKEIDISGYTIQQNVGGAPVALFRFPPKTMFAPKSHIAVFSGSSDTIMHQPPKQFVWKQQQRWGTGPECTTVLCKDNGQAIAWTTAAYRFGGNNVSFFRTNSAPSTPKLPSGSQTDQVFIKREKETPASLAAQRHPHGNLNSPVHPFYNENRVKELGNDNSSNNRQTRSQLITPDQVPGELYAGQVGQRMGSSTMRRYTPLYSGNVRKNGSITNRIDGNIRFGIASPFHSPHQQEFARALENKSTSLMAGVSFQ